MGIKKKWSQEQRDQIVRLRLAGKSWPKIAKETGVPKSTVIGIWKEHSTEPEPPKLKQIIQARVLKLVPNPRLMLIYFEDREGVARCVKKPESNHPPKSLILVKKVDDDLYRLA
tara:strand:- start:1226 stop:1567 length:342 start_codon:yes stop_codon:yes gene_type:complete